MWSYLQQLSALPGLTDERVNIPSHKEEHQHNEHEQPGEEEAEAGAPATTSGSEMPTEGGNVGGPPVCTYIMKKVPPQSAVQERSMGSTFGCRPRGPRTRPRRLHSTTSRTTQDTIRNTIHLGKRAHTQRVPLKLPGVPALITHITCAHANALPDVLGKIHIW